MPPGSLSPHSNRFSLTTAATSVGNIHTRPHHVTRSNVARPQHPLRSWGVIVIDPNSRLANIVIVLGAPMFATFLWFQVEEFWLAYKSLDWPATDGKVLQSEVKKRTKGFEAKVRYSYIVDGDTLENDTIAFGLFRGMKSYVDEKVSKFPKGKGVTVFHDPTQPEVSCLERGGVGWPDIFMLVVCVSGLAMAFYYMSLFVRNRLRFKRGRDRIRAESP